MLSCIDSFAVSPRQTMLKALEVGNLKVTPASLSRCKFPIKMLNAILCEDTGELLEYRHLVQNPKYCNLWKKSYGNEFGWRKASQGT